MDVGREVSDLQTLCMEAAADSLHLVTSQDARSRRLEFKCHTPFSIPHLADQFLRILQQKGKLDDATLSLFDKTGDRHTCSLQCVYLSSVPPPLTLPQQWAFSLTCAGLRVLQTHSLTELSLVQILGVRVDLVLKSLSQATRRNLNTLRVERCDPVSVTARVACRFTNVRNLSLVATGFSDDDVITIANARLPCLEMLDLSSNGNITDITPLEVYKDKLRSLSLRDCMLKDDLTIPTLRQTSRLEALDVMLQPPHHASFAQQHTWFYFVGRNDHITKLKGESVLGLTTSLQHLKFLDISGRGSVSENALRRFLASQQSLRYIGLLHCEVSCSNLMTRGPGHTTPSFKVFGDGSEEQIVEAARRYIPLDVFVVDVLYGLRLFCRTTQHRQQLVKLILQSLSSRQSSRDMEVLHQAVMCLTDLIPLFSEPLAFPLSQALVTRAVELTEVAWRPFRKQLFAQASCSSVKQNALGQAVQLFKSLCGFSNTLQRR